MFAGVGFHSGSRWGDYTRTEVDPSDGMSFYHVNQYAQSGLWHTRVGKFNFVGGGSPTPTPTPTSHSHSHSHSNGDSYCDGCAKVYSNTKASPDATAAPVSRRAVGPKSVAVVPGSTPTKYPKQAFKRVDEATVPF